MDRSADDPLTLIVVTGYPVRLSPGDPGHDKYAMALQVSMRIGKKMNPHGAPTYRLEPSDVRTVLLRPDPGGSGRA